MFFIIFTITWKSNSYLLFSAIFQGIVRPHIHKMTFKLVKSSTIQPTFARLQHFYSTSQREREERGEEERARSSRTRVKIWNIAICPRRFLLFRARLVWNFHKDNSRSSNFHGKFMQRPLFPHPPVNLLRGELIHQLMEPRSRKRKWQPRAERIDKISPLAFIFDRIRPVLFRNSCHETTTSTATNAIGCSEHRMYHNYRSSDRHEKVTRRRHGSVSCDGLQFDVPRERD